MKTQNGRELGLRDQAVGIDAGGRAIGGEIIEIDAKNNRALLSPALMHPSWVDAGNLYAPPTYQDPNKAKPAAQRPVQNTEPVVPTQPPIDNAHVAPGAEQFAEPTKTATEQVDAPTKTATDEAEGAH